MVNVSQVTHRGSCARTVDDARRARRTGPKSGRRLTRHFTRVLHDALARS